jgi:hypothetical protein
LELADERVLLGYYTIFVVQLRLQVLHRVIQCRIISLFFYFLFYFFFFFW